MVAEERWIGVDAVATHLSVAKDSVYRWIEERGLPAYRAGRLYRFKLSEIDDWMRQGNKREKTQSSAQRPPSSRSRVNQLSPKKCSREESGNE